MSRAFVKEDVEVAEVLPERPVSPHRNFVTASGLRQMDDAISCLRAQVTAATAASDPVAIGSLSRDLRYWLTRRASAELVDQPATGAEVRFGSTVSVERADGRRQTFRIVGEDEADPKAGTLSYLSPLARALVGKAPGDDIAFMGDELTILDVR